MTQAQAKAPVQPTKNFSFDLPNTMHTLIVPNANSTELCHNMLSSQKINEGEVKDGSSFGFQKSRRVIDSSVRDDFLELYIWESLMKLIVLKKTQQNNWIVELGEFRGILRDVLVREFMDIGNNEYCWIEIFLNFTGNNDLFCLLKEFHDSTYENINFLVRISI
jgi:hypothetical protein